MLLTTLFLIFCVIALTGYTIIPMVSRHMSVLSAKRQQTMTSRMEQLLPRQEAQKISKIFFAAPILFGAVFYFMAPSEEMRVVAVVLGVLAGIILPGMYIKILREKTRQKFTDQLVDALMIMSSSFKGGLSLIQAMEAVVDEMSDPINREFGIVLGENKMGVSIEDALYHLYNRMSSVALQQMITAILLARETGGNLPLIFSRIVTNIRETKKIQQNIQTLTLQGKIQGSVMTLLPIAFGFVVYSTNPRMINTMLTTDIGRFLLIYAVISWVIGAGLILKISTFKDF